MREDPKKFDVPTLIGRRMQPFHDDVDRLCTIPGLDRVTAWGLLADIGLNMDQFPSAAHLASWAGQCDDALPQYQQLQLDDKSRN